MESFKNTIREDESIELVGGRTQLVLARSIFRRCTIIGRVTAGGLTVVETTFEQCAIRWKKPVNNMDWLSARFSGCTFEGRYIGNRFGGRPEDPLGSGCMIECDLSKAFLDGTDFLNCDMSRIKLPRWPFFTWLDVARNSAKWLELADGLPLPLRSKLKVAATAYPETSAVTWSATKLAKELGGTEADVLALVRELPGVLY